MESILVKRRLGCLERVSYGSRYDAWRQLTLADSSPSDCWPSWMHAKYGDAVGLDVNDGACCRARRSESVPGVVGCGTRVVVSVNRRGGCAAPDRGVCGNHNA